MLPSAATVTVKVCWPPGVSLMMQVNVFPPVLKVDWTEAARVTGLLNPDGVGVGAGVVVTVCVTRTTVCAWLSRTRRR